MIDLTKIPFESGLEIPGPDYAGELELVLHAEPGDHVHPLDDTPLTLAPSQELSELFAACLHEGVLGLPDTRMELLGTTRDAERWISVYEVAALPWASFAYLLAVLTQARHALDPLSRLTVRPRGTCDTVYTHQHLGALTQPAPALRGGRGVTTLHMGVDPRTARSFDVGLEFGGPLTREQFDRVSQGLAVWDEMRMVGGLRLDLEEQEAGPLGGIVHRLPAVVTLGVDEPYAGELAAFHGLVEYGRRLEAEGLRVAHIVVE